MPRAVDAGRPRRLSPVERLAFDRLVALGATIDPGFTQDLRSAFRALARRYHPDRHPGGSATEKARLAQRFVELHDAYRRLHAGFVDCRLICRLVRGMQIGRETSRNPQITICNLNYRPRMNLERMRRICLAFPGATEKVQWGADLVFKVGGKMFAVAATDPGAAHRLSFKCSPEGFAELVEVEGAVPAPYLARAQWVALERFDVLTDRQLETRLGEAYELVFAKLTKKDQGAIGRGRRRSSA